MVIVGHRRIRNGLVILTGRILQGSGLRPLSRRRRPCPGDDRRHRLGPRELPPGSVSVEIRQGGRSGRVAARSLASASPTLEHVAALVDTDEYLHRVESGVWETGQWARQGQVLSLTGYCGHARMNSDRPYTVRGWWSRGSARSPIGQTPSRGDRPLMIPTPSFSPGSLSATPPGRRRPFETRARHSAIGPRAVCF